MGHFATTGKPAREHPAYDPQDAAIDAAERDRPDPLGDDASDDSHSALFSLDILDATGLDADYRGVSPLGHHGDSEKYFVVIETRAVAYDHKYKAAYTPLTYLLCDADERSLDDPNSRLSDKEVFVAWRHAKREGILLNDDKVTPHTADFHRYGVTETVKEECIVTVPRTGGVIDILSVFTNHHISYIQPQQAEKLWFTLRWRGVHPNLVEVIPQIDIVSR